MLFSSILQPASADGETYSLNPYYQIYNVSLYKQFNKFINPQCFNYGVYTKYNPLTDIQQLGDIGILDSNCYHISHTIDHIQYNINFLYYDCMDYEKQQIEKTYTFIGADGNIYKKSYYLNINEYESYWYLLGISINTVEEKVVIYLFKNDQILGIQEYNIKYPYYDADLVLIYGGSLEINSNQTLFNEQISKLSYFPGIYRRTDIESSDNMQECSVKYFENSIKGTFFLCKCFSKISNIPNSVISQLNRSYLRASNLTCDSFNFQTWIRIKGRNYYIKDIYYQLIKISSHFLNPKLLDDNLCAFQLYYKLTGSLNQIIITTYSYTFPTVNIGESDNPFQLRKPSIQMQIYNYGIWQE